MHTRAQRWAQDAYERVQARARTGEAGEYKDMALKLPVLIRQAGLAQALAFVESRGKAAHKSLGEDLARTLGYEGLRDLSAQARKAPLLEYLRLTREVLGAADWYKRFAQALIEE
ncbi:type III-B CRISPR module-associated protein Cmr5 [Marinithermus hydrothermalis]|uniref:CRISPR type III-B/RAMP module-associated protein Cmr5 n=1 Tax=Marinithermus hydrothermalis (strain DSM 14884 / JCM 11576 / T1) TaxID=869210 RepID=F2NKH7_MARHT|nr:type III-B CRISPR module-associated protein Cmr5 [Marinithermus hydrothermalis]AEB12637.1 CRISPR-associated protein, Cmr5 family [Marinithermus hydrothermalis DSM 14884]